MTDKQASKFKKVFIGMLLLIVGGFSLLILRPEMAKAAGGQNLTDANPAIIDNISVNKNTVSNGQNLQITVTFSEKKEDQIQPGDYIEIKLPPALVGYTATKTLMNNEGQALGTVYVSNGEAKIIFNNGIDGQTLQDVKGWFTFTVQAHATTNGTTSTTNGNTITHTVNTHWGVPNITPPKVSINSNHGTGQGTGGAPVKPSVDVNNQKFTKSGYMGTGGNVNWQISGVTPNGTGEISIVDNLSKGQTFNQNTFAFRIKDQYGNVTVLNYKQFQSELNGSIDVSSSTPQTVTFTFDADLLDGSAWEIDYRGMVSDHSIPSLSNSAKMTYNTTDGSKKSVQTSKTVSNTSISGGISGIIPKNGVVLQKVDDQGNNLQGATFELTGNGKTENATSDADGKITFTGLTNGKTYTISETQAPTGYEKINGTISVTIQNGEPKITYDGQTVTNKIMQITDKKTVGKATIKKTNSSGKALSGATFTLTNSKTGLQSNVTTDTNGDAVFDNLEPGNYTVQETQAPTGYQTDGTVYNLTVNNDGTVSSSDLKGSNGNYTVVDQTEASFSFKKANANNTKGLQGAVFQLQSLIYDPQTSEGTVVATATSNADGTVTFNNVPNGQYILVEIMAPDGYKVDTLGAGSVDVQNGKVTMLGMNNSTYAKVWTDEAYKGNFSFTKIASDTKKGLAGATFNLSGNGFEQKATSDSTGKVSFTNIPDGTYTLTETNAPSGYEKLTKTYQVTLKNGKATSNLPSNNELVDEKNQSSSSSSKSSSSSLSSSKSSSSSLVISSSSSKSSLSSLVSSSSNSKSSLSSLVSSSSSSKSSSSSLVSSSSSSKSSSSSLINSSSSSITASSSNSIIVPVVQSSSSSQTLTPVSSSSSKTSVPVMNSSSSTAALISTPVMNSSSSTAASIPTPVMSSSTSSQLLVPAPVESSSSSVNVISSSNETSTAPLAPVATPVQSSSSSAQGASSNADTSIGKQNGNSENGTGKGKSQGVLPQTGDQAEGVLAVIAGIVLVGIVGMIVYRKQQ
ncbi:MAG TPA: LPXTG cell wall anchor domain-containing protein [Candidatus Ligilactobacillus excrementigallinarum]|uniref:LPXTG cell wall anchor domain-containing protein n=1 Tax=Candidatus Ligilactobacillus excrementigallinarum TaxID=2838641 RepID=A0A9D1UVW6_9LACO|nr:LPXTG cell wall anchor domain-containing protein [Candidatus Ligilactobacillus excrementigallinarum]